MKVGSGHNSNLINYYLFLFISTFVRNIVAVFSCILLYKKGYDVKEILLFMTVIYGMGVIVNYFSLLFNYKISLIISNLFYGGSYFYLMIMPYGIPNLFILAIMLSIGSYSYHAIRHYLALKVQNYNNKKISYLLFVIYMACFVANILGIVILKKCSSYVIGIIMVLLSFISIFPVFKLTNISREKINLKSVSIRWEKIVYSVLEQFKVILMELQPLYLYVYVKGSISYIGWFNIVILIASVMVMMVVGKRLKLTLFKYINMLLALVIFLKLNINNIYLLMFIAFLEGIGMKLYEMFSLNNLYRIDANSVDSYLILQEIIFFGSKTLFMIIFLFLGFSLKNILYVCIIGMILSVFYLD